MGLGPFVRCAVIVVAALAMGGAPARAQDRSPEDAARDRFEEGRLAFERGDYAVALARFEHAYDLSGRAELLFNIGIAHERLQQDEQAVEAFERYLTLLPDALNRREVEARAAELRRAIAERDELASESVLEKWWFWTAVAAVVIGGFVVTAVLVSDPGTDPPLVGNTGAVTTALGARW